MEDSQPVLILLKGKFKQGQKVMEVKTKKIYRVASVLPEHEYLVQRLEVQYHAIKKYYKPTTEITTIVEKKLILVK